jgi:hypothetical protein
MASALQITSISNHHGKTARVVELAVSVKTLIKAITPKTITIR